MAAPHMIPVAKPWLGEAEAAVVHAPSQRFFSLWRAPDASAIEALVQGIAASGWHDYFETVNATGLVALTFDDGPDPTWTPQILSILKAKGLSR